MDIEARSIEASLKGLRNALDSSHLSPSKRAEMDLLLSQLEEKLSACSSPRNDRSRPLTAWELD